MADQVLEGRTILVVDDDKVIRDYLESLLGSAGYLVITARDGAQTGEPE